MQYYFGFDRPSFGIKTYGFGSSSPKLQADFTKGTYKADGAAKTFEDLFTFNRAGKAWLVKEEGLQEYAADVPRFDDGLLIEQEATNHITNSNMLQSLATGDINGGSWLPDGGYLTTDSNTSVTVFNYISGLSGGYVLTLYISDVIPVTWPVFDADFYAALSGAKASTVTTQGSLSKAVVATTQINGVASVGLSRPNTALYVKRTFTLKYWQLEKDQESTLIKTSGVAVTRPADYLLNKITGTTVTGDWDSTLTLSIVEGQLVHSGYGRIRSLEIN